jgi:transposase
MKHHAGLDVSIKETSVCVVDEGGKVCREMKVPSHPEDLVQALKDPAWCLERVGLEAGPLSQWLFSGLAEAGLPVVCIETRHTKAFLKAQVNKSDRNDARGIAQMMRVDLFRRVHVKTLTSQRCRALLTARKLLQEKAIAIDNDIRGLLRNFGLKVGPVGAPLGGGASLSHYLIISSATFFRMSSAICPPRLPPQLHRAGIETPPLGPLSASLRSI